MNDTILSENGGSYTAVNLLQWLQVISILLTGLLAGLFYGYDCSVIKGLGKLPDEMYLHSFQSINKAILNPYFFLSFMGCLIALPITTYVCYKSNLPFSFYLLLAATLLYTIGVFGITMMENVPLNNLLEKFDSVSASEMLLKEMRQQFEKNWNFWHHIRTYAAMLSFLFSILSLIKKS